MAFVSLDFINTGKVSGFIRYCGELVIMTGLLAIAGVILSGMTILLFGIIGMEIEEFYVEKIIYRYLPIYFLYCVVVIFVFPFIFGMR